MFCTVGLALWGLPYYYDFMVRQFGWTRSQVTSGNAISKLLIGPAFGFLAGWMIDRFGPRRVMMAGILMASIALVGLGTVSSLRMFYFFYILNALGFVCGGPLPNQVLLSECFEKSRGKAMGFAYLRIGIGGAMVPWISNFLGQHLGWQAALRSGGLLILALALPAAYFVKEPPASRISELPRSQSTRPPVFDIKGLYDSPLLSVGNRKYVLSCSHQRCATELKIVSGSGPSICPEPCSAVLVARFDLQHRRSLDHGMAGRPLPPQVRDGFDLFACRNRDSHRDIESVAFVSVRLLGCFWNWPGT
jgi:MFS family permease